MFQKEEALTLSTAFRNKVGLSTLSFCLALNIWQWKVWGCAPHKCMLVSQCESLEPCALCAGPQEQPGRLRPLRTCSRPIRVGLSKRAKARRLHHPHPYKWPSETQVVRIDSTEVPFLLFSSSQYLVRLRLHASVLVFLFFSGSQWGCSAYRHPEVCQWLKKPLLFCQNLTCLFLSILPVIVKC